MRRMDHKLDNLEELIVVGAGTGKKRLVDCILEVTEVLGWSLSLLKILRGCIVLDLLLEVGQPVLNTDVYKVKSCRQVLG